jgi:hypothetical protein
LKPPLLKKADAWKFLNELNEERLVKTLKANKVAVKFRRNLGKIGVTEDEVRSLQVVSDFYEKLNARIKEDSEEYDKVAEEFLQRGITPILIKSDGTFPYESDNLDALVKAADLAEATRQLMRIGYHEVVQVQEPHKFLFRKSEVSLAIHLHTRVEWEGTQFVDTDHLWNNSKTSTDSDKFLVPSPEDFLLIVTAHFFFENHSIKLEDLDKVSSCIQEHQINWKQVLYDAKEQRWDSAFVLAVLLCDAVHRRLYGRSMMQKSLLSEFEESSITLQPFLKTVRPSDNHEPLLKIPYAVSAIFFISRVLRDETLTSIDKVRHLNYVASNVLWIRAKQL